MFNREEADMRNTKPELGCKSGVNTPWYISRVRLVCLPHIVQQSPNDVNIQSILAAVMNNLNGLPSANSLEYRFINEQDELRNAFAISRNANGDRVVKPKLSLFLQTPTQPMQAVFATLS